VISNDAHREVRVVVGEAVAAEHEDADEDDPVEPRDGVDTLLGAAPGGVEPRLERRGE
jgi:hypothetical protein